MTTALQQLRALRRSGGSDNDNDSGDDDDSSGVDPPYAQGRRELYALRPVPACCPSVHFFIYLSIDGCWLGHIGEGTGLGASVDVAPPDIAACVQWCPCCGSHLPAVRMKSVQSPSLCVCTDGGYYCDTCNERLDCCWCDPIESAYELVPAAALASTAPTTPPIPYPPSPQCDTVCDCGGVNGKHYHAPMWVALVSAGIMLLLFVWALVLAFAQRQTY